MDVDDCNGQSNISGWANFITDLFSVDSISKILYFIVDKKILIIFLFAASGDSSMEREFSGGLGGPTVSTPNSKETSPSRSLSGQYEHSHYQYQFFLRLETYHSVHSYFVICTASMPL